MVPRVQGRVHGSIGPVERSASFSPDRRYRYRLDRRWSDHAPAVVWVMLNPSAADANCDDPTIRRVIALSRAWGYGGCTVVNLFGWRAVRPRDLAAAVDPVGPGNRRAVACALDEAADHGVIVAGWGAWRAPGVPVDAAVRRLLAAARRRDVRPVAVARNRDGSPRHPLYVPRVASYSDLE